MKTAKFLPIYLAMVLLTSGLPIFGFQDFIDVARANPDIVINSDWTVTGLENYSDEKITVHGDITIQNGGHLVLNNCTLEMMYLYLQPYSIIVESGGTIELYDCYITDTPDDDDFDMLSAWYYFIAREGSTLIIENSTLRQVGFMDPSNLEHMGLSIGTNQGHITNSRINTSIVGLSFTGNNTDFYVENVNITEIFMKGIFMIYAQGGLIRNVTFQNIGEDAVADFQNSQDFTCSDIELSGEQVMRTYQSSGFALDNITGYGCERLLQINDCDDFDLKYITHFGSHEFNQMIRLEGCTDFDIQHVYAKNEYDILNIEDSTGGRIIDVTGENITRAFNFIQVNAMEVSGLSIDNSSDTIWLENSENITMENIFLSEAYRPFQLRGVNASSFTNLTFMDFDDLAIDILQGSNNVDVSDVYMETDSMWFTSGFRIDQSSATLCDIEMFNTNRSIYAYMADLRAEDITIHGAYDGDEGLLIDRAQNIYLSNVSIKNQKFRGIWITNSPDSDIKMENIYIENINDAVLIQDANATLSNLVVTGATYDILAAGFTHRCSVTVMNSTLDRPYISDSDMVFINTTNATSASTGGIWSLTWKWWVDVYVHDSMGPVAGAEARIFDSFFVIEITAYTEIDGFARYLPVTEMIWNNIVPVSRNPHTSSALGSGWGASNSTPYWVTQNMQVNVYYPWNAPPNEPTNLVAQSDENSDVVLTWDPSTSWDVGNYTVYIARSESELLTYMGIGIPNATVQVPTFTHVSGADDWGKFWYGVKSKDDENESINGIKGYCGDWVVNATSPQFVEGEDISVEGSVWIHGQLVMGNTSFKVHSSNRYWHGIYLHIGSYFRCENVTIERNTTYPYYFIIETGAEVVINGSYIKEPGYDEFYYEEHFKGIYSITEKLTITNTTIEVIYRGLCIFGVPNLQGQLYNNTFKVPPGEDAEILLKISSSGYVDVEACFFEGEVEYAVYMEFSYGITVTGSNISIFGDWGETYYGIYIQECIDTYIYNSPLIYGSPAIYFIGSINTTIYSSIIISKRNKGIYGSFSHQITIGQCDVDNEEGDDKTRIYLSWCSDSTIEDMYQEDVHPFLFLDNCSGGTINNLTLVNGENGIWLINSNNIHVYNTYVTFMMSGITVTGCRDIVFYNTTVNLTFYCMTIKSPGPINFIDCAISNGIANEIIAEGWGGEQGEIILTNCTIESISEHSMALNNSAVVSLLNTSFNFTKLQIDDAGSRVEVYHFLSIQVYDIDMNIPAWANITIFNSIDFTVYNGQVAGGFAQWIIIHEKTIFRDGNYSDNPHRIVFNDGSHSGDVSLYINETKHVDVNVSNNAPWISWLEIHGQKGIQVSLNPTTDYNIVLNYGYEDSEGDPESGTIIRWLVNGWVNGSFNDMTTIPSQYTHKGQFWQAVVYPSDGYDGTYPTSPFVTNVLFIENTPPEVSNVTITPSDPTGGDDLFVDYDAFDLDQDGLDISKTTHKWYFFNDVSGLWEYSSIDSFYLSSQYTSKGQFWHCKVTPNDGDDDGTTKTSNIVQIGNTPPSASNAKITAESGELMITGADNLKATYNFTDPDGDFENGTTFEWYLKRGDDPWTSYAVNASVLPFNYTLQGDLWRCMIIPMDGEDYGAMVWTDIVEIFNTPPEVFNVTITPASPTSSDSLSITYDFHDYDGDTDNGTSFRWVFEDALGAKDPGEYGDEVPASEIQKGQTWYCYVKPSDGMNVGTEVISPGVPILNSPPTVISADIEMITMDSGRHLALNYNALDVDADAFTDIDIQWFADGSAQSLFDDNQSVPSEALVKGQLWYVSMRVFDGEAWSVWFHTNEIAIPNTAPYLNGTPVLIPQKALSSEDLVPAFQSFFQDDDGDTMVWWEVKWYKDNGHMEVHDGLEKISWDLTKKGEMWFCKIQVSDGEDKSEWYSSTTSVIENTPPSNVTAYPYQSVVSFVETETMEFNATAQDSDDDTLSYRWMLDGRIVLLEEGVKSSIYRMKTDYDSEGEYLLRLVITDGDDIYENTWAITVQKKNRLPEITVIAPEGRSATIDEGQSLAFSIIKADPDGDSLDVFWYVDGVLTWEASDKYTYTPGFEASGNREITVEVRETESLDNSTYTWDIEVRNVVDVDRTERLLGFSYDWWGLVLAILSGIVAILLATIGLMRVRRKKGRLKEYMKETDRLMEEEDPTTIEEKLLEIEHQIKDEFSHGKIEDLHFLLLQDIIAGKRGEIRKAAVTRKFGRLPEGVLRDLDTMLKDGKISKEEYATFVSTVSKSESLTPEEKEELSGMIGRWEKEDKDILPAELKEDIGLEEHLEDDSLEEYKQENESEERKTYSELIPEDEVEDSGKKDSDSEEDEEQPEE